MQPTQLNRFSLDDLIAYRRLREEGFNPQDILQADIEEQGAEIQAEIDAYAGALNRHLGNGEGRIDGLADAMGNIHITSAAETATQELQNQVVQSQAINDLGHESLKKSSVDLQRQRECCEELQTTLGSLRRKVSAQTSDPLRILPLLHQGGRKLSEKIAENTRESTQDKLSFK